MTREQKRVLTIHSDGGARGNPGPSASAYVIEEDGNEVFRDARYFGTSTNNQAEYQGVIMALTWISKSKNYSKVDKINFYVDSQLIARQLSGDYKIKNDELKKLAVIAKNLEKKIDAKIEYIYVPRDKNKAPDKMLNEILDDNA